MAPPEVSGEWITLAVVIKTQGRHGEVAVESHTDVPDRITAEDAIVGAAERWPAQRTEDRRSLAAQEFSGA